MIPLLPFIRDEFALDYTQAGWVGLAYNLSYGISQIPAGWLVDRLGPRTLVVIGISGVALATLLAALSPTYIVLLVLLVLLGVTGGGYHPAAATLISTSVEPRNRGRALGFHQIGGSISFFTAPLLVVAITTALGWRGTLIGIAVPIAILGIIFYVFLSRWRHTEKDEDTVPGRHTETSPTPGHLRSLVAFLTLSITGAVLIYSLMYFAPLFFVDHFGVNEKAAAAILSIFFATGLWAGPLGGYLADRFGMVRVLLAASLVAGPTIYLLNLASYGWSICVLLLVLGTAMHVSMPVTEAYIISHAPERYRSTILGIYYFGSRGGPGVIIPVIGYLIDQFSFYPTYVIVGATMFAVTLGCFIFLRKGQE